MSDELTKAIENLMDVGKQLWCKYKDGYYYYGIPAPGYDPPTEEELEFRHKAKTELIGLIHDVLVETGKEGARSFLSEPISPNLACPEPIIPNLDPTIKHHEEKENRGGKG